MGAIKEGFDTTFRDFTTDGVAASGPFEPVKAQIRTLGRLVELGIANSALGALLAAKFDTLAAANAGGGSLDYDDGSVAIVFADPDTDNNDLIVKAGVSGAGNWTVTTVLHDAAGSISADILALALKGVVIPCTVAGTANSPVLTPKAGYFLPDGGEKLFSFVPTADSTGAVTIDVVPLTGGDARWLRLANDEPTGSAPRVLLAGRLTTIQFNPVSGTFQIVSPYPDLMFADGEVELTQTNVSDTGFVAKPAQTGLIIDGSETFTLTAPSDRQGGALFGVTLDITGLTNGDARFVVLPNGSPVGGNAWFAGDTLVFTFDNVTGEFVLEEVRDGNAPATASLSTYQKIALLGASRNAAAALTLARQQA